MVYTMNKFSDVAFAICRHFLGVANVTEVPVISAGSNTDVRSGLMGQHPRASIYM